MCVGEYLSVLECMNILAKDACLPFSYEEYLNGYTFFAWNLTPDYQCARQNTAKRANIRLDLKFSEALPTSINIMLYATFDSVMIVGSGQVMTDYNDQ